MFTQRVQASNYAPRRSSLRNMSSRRRRRLRRHFGELCCDWCGHFGQVLPGTNWRALGFDAWAAYANANPVWLCQRASCIASRT